VKLFAHILSTLWFATALTTGAQTISLHTAAQDGSAPKFIESDGPATGLCPDIFQAMEKADKGLHIDIDPRPTPVKRLEAELKEGHLDVVCALLDTSQRNAIAYRISTPLYVLTERLVGRRDDDGIITHVRDLAQTGDLVVTQSGASYAADVRRPGVQVMETPGGSVVALRNVLSKRARFYYTNELTGAYYIRSEGLDDQLRLHPGVLQFSPSYLWVSRKVDPAVVQRIEQAAAQLKRSGELDRIYQRYQKEH
jgi:ABC-type amino acid transport substrate-binding protein